MKSSMLTLDQVKSLNLEEVTWSYIKKIGASKVYLQASPASPVYGPYRVVDPDRCLISRLDGTATRAYLRDKGLMVSTIYERPTPKKSTREALSGDRVVLDGLIYLVNEKILKMETELEELYSIQDRLEETASRLKE